MCFTIFMYIQINMNSTCASFSSLPVKDSNLNVRRIALLRECGLELKMLMAHRLLEDRSTVWYMVLNIIRFWRNIGNMQQVYFYSFYHYNNHHQHHNPHHHLHHCQLQVSFSVLAHIKQATFSNQNILYDLLFNISFSEYHMVGHFKTVAYTLHWSSRKTIGYNWCLKQLHQRIQYSDQRAKLGIV